MERFAVSRAAAASPRRGGRRGFAFGAALGRLARFAAAASFAFTLAGFATTASLAFATFSFALQFTLLLRSTSVLSHIAHHFARGQTALKSCGCCCIDERCGAEPEQHQQPQGGRRSRHGHQSTVSSAEQDYLLVDTSCCYGYRNSLGSQLDWCCYSRLVQVDLSRVYSSAPKLVLEEV